MTFPATVVPYSLKTASALIEKLLPVQKLSAEAFKEQEGRQSKTLTPLGSYWKGRKPLILNKACVLGCLLPATADLERDLVIFEKLMAMDDESFVVRLGRPRPEHLLADIRIPDIYEYFAVEPPGILPASAPIDLRDYEGVKVKWLAGIPEAARRCLEAQLLELRTYREAVEAAKRPEEVGETVHDHIWDEVNAHLGTMAQSFPELVEQLGVMRFGHRPRVADTFCGSGQIPFEAARLGCDVYASDLNPVACMLTWGAFNIAGGSPESSEALRGAQRDLVVKVRAAIDALGVEKDGTGWRGKAYLYCVEARCPQTGWLVPLLPSRILSKSYRAIVELVPDPALKRYNLVVRSGVNDKTLEQAESGTVRSDGRGQDPYLVHTVAGVDYRTKISTLRGDHVRQDGSIGNRLRQWAKADCKPHPDDIFQERLYAILWTRPKPKGKRDEHEFRTVTEEDRDRERTVEAYVVDHLSEWQAQGWLPDMRIEPGEKTDEPIRTRGWTHWHHLFNPRQLLVAGLISQFSDAKLKFGLTQVLNNNCRSSRWHPSSGVGQTVGIFDNQALNTLFNYGCRGVESAASFLLQEYKNFPFAGDISAVVGNHSAEQLNQENDVYITDPPYGDAVKYEEILEFFIAWLQKNPPEEFASWVWDSRRALAIKGEDEDFRLGMVAAYRRMTELMPDNGIQVIMFTHQDGAIWADMANIVWAAGLQVTAAWYVVTETDSALRQGSHVKGTILLVLRKRGGNYKATRDDLAWEIQEEVEAQVQTLTGLNQRIRNSNRDENLFEDADLQMAGYAAALRVLTRYSVINGKEMAGEALRPRVKGQPTFVDELIEFAVSVANQSLVPLGIDRADWEGLAPAERFYLKLLELEARGQRTLDNYQNFAKAFKVASFRPFMASQKANSARLKSAVEFGRAELSEGSELHNTVLRGILYAMMELVKGKDGDEVLAHLALNVPNYYDAAQRNLVVELADYLAGKLESLRPEEASAARILRELVRNQRL